MALISSQLQWLEAELESAIEECGQVVEQNNAWLAETIQKNTKNLQYQTCARSPWGRGGRARGGRGSRACAPASEPPQPSPSRRRNPSLECPRSQRKPVRRGRQKAMAAVTVRLPAQPVRRNACTLIICARFCSQEEPEEKENTANGDVAAERDVVPRRLGLSARDDSTRGAPGRPPSAHTVRPLPAQPALGRACPRLAATTRFRALTSPACLPLRRRGRLEASVGGRRPDRRDQARQA